MSRVTFNANTSSMKDSFEAVAGVTVRGCDNIRILAVGWGYDEEVPLRPWPQVWRKEVANGTRVGASWCGFFVAASL
jgi:hypothetical protein